MTDSTATEDTQELITDMLVDEETTTQEVVTNGIDNNEEQEMLVEHIEENAEKEAVSNEEQTVPEHDLEESSKQTESNDVIVLDEVLHISQLDVLYQVLSSNLDTHKQIKIDASKVEKVDGVSLQTLGSFYQSAQREKIDISWIALSDTFKDASELLGVNNLIGIENN